MGGGGNLLVFALFELLVMTALVGLLIAPLSAQTIILNDGQEHWNWGTLGDVNISGEGTSLVNEGTVGRSAIHNGVFNNNVDGVVGSVEALGSSVFNNYGTVEVLVLAHNVWVGDGIRAVINNYGTIEGFVVLWEGGVCNNDGTVVGDAGVQGGVFSNNGTMFNNNGTIGGQASVSDGGEFNNHGTIKGNASASSYLDFVSLFNNTGTIEGNADIYEGGVFNNDEIVKGNANVMWGGVFNNDGIVKGNASVSVINENYPSGGEFNNTGTINGKADIYRDGVMNNESTGRIEGSVFLRGENGELVHNGWIGGDVTVYGGELSGGGQIDGTLHIASGGIVDTALFTGIINKLILDEGGTLVFNLDLLNGDFSTLNFAPEPAPFSIMSVFASSLLSNSDLMELNGTVLINILNDEFVDVETKYEAQSLLGGLLSSLNIDPTTPEVFSNWTVQSTNYLVSISDDGMLSFERKDGGGAEPPVTPEPATLLLIGLGLAGLPIIRKRMRQAA